MSGHDVLHQRASGCECAMCVGGLLSTDSTRVPSLFLLQGVLCCMCLSPHSRAIDSNHLWFIVIVGEWGDVLLVESCMM